MATPNRFHPLAEGFRRKLISASMPGLPRLSLKPPIAFSRSFSTATCSLGIRHAPSSHAGRACGSSPPPDARSWPLDRMRGPSSRNASNASVARLRPTSGLKHLSNHLYPKDRRVCADIDKAGNTRHGFRSFHGGMRSPASNGCGRRGGSPRLSLRLLRGAALQLRTGWLLWTGVVFRRHIHRRRALVSRSRPFLRPCRSWSRLPRGLSRATACTRRASRPQPCAIPRSSHA